MTRDQAGGGNTPQHESKHPEEWSEDLEGDRLAGQNVGPQGGRPGDEGPTAGEIPELREKLTGFRKDELDRIPIVPEGQRVRQGASYLDLGDAGGSEFTATGEMTGSASPPIVAPGVPEGRLGSTKSAPAGFRRGRFLIEAYLRLSRAPARSASLPRSSSRRSTTRPRSPAACSGT